MKRLFFVTVLLCVSGSAFAVDYSVQVPQTKAEIGRYQIIVPELASANRMVVLDTATGKVWIDTLGGKSDWVCYNLPKQYQPRKTDSLGFDLE